jgi:hypothetical protein
LAIFRLPKIPNCSPNTCCRCWGSWGGSIPICPRSNPPATRTATAPSAAPVDAHHVTPPAPNDGGQRHRDRGRGRSPVRRPSKALRQEVCRLLSEWRVRRKYSVVFQRRDGFATKAAPCRLRSPATIPHVGCPDRSQGCSQRRRPPTHGGQRGAPQNVSDAFGLPIQITTNLAEKPGQRSIRSKAPQAPPQPPSQLGDPTP